MNVRKISVFLSIFLGLMLSVLVFPASAGDGTISLGILNFNVIGLLNAFFPYILILVIIATLLMMFPEARGFLGGLLRR